MADQVEKLPEAYAPLINALKSMHKDPKYSDLTIKCGDQEWSVYKAIVCSQSSFFEKHCDKGWMKDEEHVITLPEDEPNVVDAMIRYTFDYSDEQHVKFEDSEPVPPIVFDVLVHMIADKNEIPSLEKLAASKFEKRAKEEWDTKPFATAATLIYTDAADRGNELKDTIMAVATEHAEALSDASTPPGLHFRDAADNVPALASALWRKHVEHVKIKVLKQYKCPYNYGCPNIKSASEIGASNTTMRCHQCGGNYHWHQWLARPA
ncbi:hypothetical protein LTR56_008593 [Elasticomyces elasticus]|nr:hypothetical protein LTR56_008593 [Elasticomyces elasticus]KAK3662199.1 hypothetical protein LTR22_006964 [Elasticomyces elasticus]KAK4916177.1 hypothetical protein LTR49_015818 [Elasticomyces elasticus]KAK5767963.1 hypothetical protein LTS12_001780 [Elasticomyces elasticus]